MEYDKNLEQLRVEFNERVQKAVRVSKEGLTPCDFWTGTTCPAWESVEKGHGRLQTDVAKHFGLLHAHHISMFLNDPEEFARRNGREMCHSCDVPHCVNPQHLRWDTHLNNVLDRELAGRTKGAVNRVGMENTNASLTSEHIQYIIDNPDKQIHEIAAAIGVDRHTISRALDGRTHYLTAEERGAIQESRKLAKIDTDVLADSASGMTDVDIAAKYSIHRKLIPVIKQRARDAGMKVVEYEDILKSKVKVALSEGKSLVKIAKELKISRGYINKLKTEMGMPPTFKRPDCAGKKKVKKENISEQ